MLYQRFLQKRKNHTKLQNISRIYKFFRKKIFLHAKKASKICKFGIFFVPLHTQKFAQEYGINKKH